MNKACTAFITGVSVLASIVLNAKIKEAVLPDQPHIPYEQSNPWEPAPQQYAGSLGGGNNNNSSMPSPSISNGNGSSV
ncbi:MAG: hypothetical protein ACLQU1_39960 [Bryobacteraceae bacterium]